MATAAVEQAALLRPDQQTNVTDDLADARTKAAVETVGTEAVTGPTARPASRCAFGSAEAALTLDANRSVPLDVRTSAAAEVLAVPVTAIYSTPGLLHLRHCGDRCQRHDGYHRDHRTDRRRVGLAAGPAPPSIAARRRRHRRRADRARLIHAVPAGRSRAHMRIANPMPRYTPTNLQMNTSDYMSITGPSGSGRSTLLNLLSLLRLPTTCSYSGRCRKDSPTAGPAPATRSGASSSVSSSSISPATGTHRRWRTSSFGCSTGRRGADSVG